MGLTWSIVGGVYIPAVQACATSLALLASAPVDILQVQLGLNCADALVVSGSGVPEVLLQLYKPEVEGELGAQRETLAPVDHQRVGLDEDVVLQRLLHLG